MHIYIHVHKHIVKHLFTVAPVQIECHLKILHESCETDPALPS